MNPVECPREDDVVAMTLSRCHDEELQAHASECEVCREAASVAALLREDAMNARADVHVPAAGQVWWRAAIRARVDGVQAAERPITWLHGLAGAAAAGLVATLLGIAWPSIEGFASWVAAREWAVMPGASDTAALILAALQRSLPLALVVATCMILAPIAIYLAVSDD